MSASRISVVIPSWNGRHLLEKHLPSVVREVESLGGTEIVVCDDGSDDGTAALLATKFPGVKIRTRERNGGFSRAVNDGVWAAAAPLVLLLNNDVGVRSGVLDALASTLEKDPRAFAAVPSIVRTEGGIDEALTRIRFRLGVVSTSIGCRPEDPPAYACGGAMAFRRDDFLRLGGFDPLFSPFYWEDVDLSYRARKRGQRIVFVPTARVDHDHGSTIGTRFERRHVSRIYERNRLLFTWKNLTDPPLWRKHLLTLPLKVCWDVAVYPAFLLGLRDALALRGRLANSRISEIAQSTVLDRSLLRR